MGSDEPVEWSRDEVDGVPLFWAPGPRLTASLMFRVGRADETLLTAGIGHLVEHLALSRLERSRYPRNGFVDGLRTVFHATGTETELVDFLYAVTSGLSFLDMGRLDLECRVLRSEAATRRPGLSEIALWYRYGNKGFGLLSQPEYGLGWLDAETVSTWANQRFNRANAALWLSGPPPSALRLALSGGTRWAAPDEVQLPEALPRSVFGSNQPAIAVSGVVDASDATVAALRIAAARGQQWLRHENGLTYGVELGFDRLDGRRLHGVLSSSALPGNLAQVLDGLLATIETLASNGPTEDELVAEREAVARGQSDPLATFEVLDRVAYGELLGVPPRSEAEIGAALDVLTPAAVSEAAAAFLATSLVVAPPGMLPSSPAYAPGVAWSQSAINGHRFRPVRGRSPGFRELIVGNDGVSGVGADGRFATVRRESCAAVTTGATRRSIIGFDGMSVVIEAGDWIDGPRAIEMVDRLFPADSVLPQDRPARLLAGQDDTQGAGRPGEEGCQAAQGSADAASVAWPRPTGAPVSPGSRSHSRIWALPRAGYELARSRFSLDPTRAAPVIAGTVVIAAALVYAIMIGASPRQSLVEPASPPAAGVVSPSASAPVSTPSHDPTAGGGMAVGSAEPSERAGADYRDDAKGFAIHLPDAWVASPGVRELSPTPDFVALVPGQGLTVVEMAGARAESLETLAKDEAATERADKRVTKTTVAYMSLPAGRAALVRASLKPSSAVATGVLTDRRTYLVTSAGYLYKLTLWARAASEQTETERHLFDGIPESLEIDKPSGKWMYTDPDLQMILVAPAKWVMTERDLEARRLAFQPAQSLAGRPPVPSVEIAFIDTGRLPDDYAPTLEAALEADGAQILDSGWATGVDPEWTIDYVRGGPNGAIRGHLLLALAYPGVATVAIEWRVASGYEPDPELLNAMNQVASSFEPIY